MADTPSIRAALAPTDYEYDPEGLTGAAATLERITAILAQRSIGGAADAEPSNRVRLSRLSPAYRDALQGELRLLRAQLYSTGLFASVANVDLG
jgi:hypothetical protein